MWAVVSKHRLHSIAGLILDGSLQELIEMILPNPWVGFGLQYY